MTVKICGPLVYFSIHHLLREVQISTVTSTFNVTFGGIEMGANSGNVSKTPQIPYFLNTPTRFCEIGRLIDNKLVECLSRHSLFGYKMHEISTYMCTNKRQQNFYLQRNGIINL